MELAFTNWLRIGPTPANLMDTLTQPSIDAGVLTDEAAASSYGQPVVLADGNAYGPGELSGLIIIREQPAPEVTAFIDRAIATGWNVSYGDPNPNATRRRHDDGGFA